MRSRRGIDAALGHHGDVGRGQRGAGAVHDEPGRPCIGCGDGRPGHVDDAAVVGDDAGRGRPRRRDRRRDVFLVEADRRHAAVGRHHGVGARPDVMTEPPRIVVVPPVEVMTPYIDTPLVEIVVSVSLATPPLVKLW